MSVYGSGGNVVAKALKATEFEAGNRHERYSGESERRKIATQGAALGGVAGASGLGATAVSGYRHAGRPAAQAGLKELAASHPNPAARNFAETTARRGAAVRSRPKTALAGIGALSAASGLAGIGARFKRNEEQGVSQGLGRIRAGAQYDRDVKRIAKGWRELTLLGSLATDPASQKAGAFVARNRKTLGGGGAVLGVGGGAAYTAAEGKRRLRERTLTRLAVAQQPVSKTVRGKPVAFVADAFAPAPKPKGFPEGREWDGGRSVYDKRTAQAKDKHDAADLKARTVDPKTIRRVPLSEHLNRNQLLNLAGSTTAAGGAGYLAGRPQRVRKADRDRGKQVLGAAAGVAATDAAYVAGGQGTKAYLKHRRGQLGETPREQQIWAEHKAKAGLAGKTRGSTSADVKHKIYTQYPKELPGWRAQRALGWKNHNGVYAGALALGAGLGAARSGKRPVEKSLSFGMVGALTGTGSLGAYAGKRGAGRKEESKEALGAAAGGWAAQGAYQGAGYGGKWAAQRKHGYGSRGEGREVMLDGPGGTKVPRTKSQENKRLKAAEKELGAKRGSVAFDRSYPKTLPEHRTHRTLGWTHRGKTGTALGTALTAGGTYLGAEMASSKKRALTRERVGKADRTYGYMERKRSTVRTAELGVGLGLGAWGVSRSKMLGPVAALGLRLAEKQGSRQARDAISLARQIGRGTREVTGRGEAQLRRIKQLDRAIEAVPESLRPSVAMTAGALLAGRAVPVHDERFVATGRGI